MGLAVLIGVVLATVGCGSKAPIEKSTGVSEGVDVGSPAASSPAASSPDASSPAASSPEVSSPERGPLGSGEAVTLAFAGDASFQGLGAAASADPGGLLSAVAPVLSDADVTMINLETAVGSGGSPEPKAFNFQAPAAVLDSLSSAGVDVVTMANNHAMDFGLDGLRATLDIKAKSKIAILGVGADATEAYTPHIATVRGQRIGFLAFNDVFDSSLVAKWTAGDGKPGIASSKTSHADRVTAAVAALRQQVDTLVVYLHYGTETQTCPNSRQKELVEQLSAAGADIIVGSHAHRLQGVGYLGDKLVAYGLGNFIFRAPSAPGRQSGVLKVTATGARIDSFKWIPAEIRGEVPVPLTGEAATRAAGEMATLQTCADLTVEPSGGARKGN
ncbi:MAG: CapA family protein [Microthrixaceae bacterium]